MEKISFNFLKFFLIIDNLNPRNSGILFSIYPTPVRPPMPYLSRHIQNLISEVNAVLTKVKCTYNSTHDFKLECANVI